MLFAGADFYELCSILQRRQAAAEFEFEGN
jgi:hypothetical protein